MQVYVEKDSEELDTSNNVNLLVPSGQFGTRNQRGGGQGESAKAKKPATKKASAAPKKIERSSVVKAYAKRLAKKKVVDSADEVDALADDPLNSPSASNSDTVVFKPTARPARRAVATKKTAKYTSNDDDEGEDEDGGFQDEGSSVAFSDSE